MAVRPASAAGIWEAPGHALSIRYSHSVLDEVRRHAMDGLRALPRGGMEVGGVLYGTREGDTVCIDASRPLECEHALGPAFVLSENDEAGLRDLIRAPHNDALLAGMHVVGWYHSHTRSGIDLTTSDLDLFERYFPHFWQVALVLRPEKSQPTRAGFFFREADGNIRHKSSYREFMVPSAAPVEQSVRSQSRRPEPPTTEQVEPPMAPVDAREPAPPAPVLREDPAPQRWTWGVLALFLGIAGIGVFAGLNWRAVPPPVLGLRALDHNGQLLIYWNRGAPAIRQSSRGALEILDGPRKVHLGLDAGQLHTGSLTYARQSDRVDLTLSLPRQGAQPIEESVAFVGQPVPSSAPGESADAAQYRRERDEALRELDRSRTETDQLGAALRKQTARTRELEEAIQVLRNRIEVEVGRRRR